MSKVQRIRKILEGYQENYPKYPKITMAGNKRTAISHKQISEDRSKTKLQPFILFYCVETDTEISIWCLYRRNCGRFVD